MKVIRSIFSAQRGSLWSAGLGVVLGATIAAAAVGQIVSASEYVPPGANPPEGNMPSTVWNRLDLNEPQGNAAIQIDGGGPGEVDVGGAPTSSGIPIGLSVGTPALDMGVNFGGQNILYGVADYGSMAAGSATGYDYLMLLQTAVGSTHTDRFAVDRDGNVMASGDVSTTGRITTTGCFGPIFVGRSGLPYRGNLSGASTGYEAANAICAGDFGGDAHVCSVAELLNSIKCATGSSPIKDPLLDGTEAWVNAGPPGYTSTANDCNGWQTDQPYDPATLDGYYGRIWRFNSANSGNGFVTTCNVAVRFACCK